VTNQGAGLRRQADEADAERRRAELALLAAKEEKEFGLDVLIFFVFNLNISLPLRL